MSAFVYSGAVSDVKHTSQSNIWAQRVSHASAERLAHFERTCWCVRVELRPLLGGATSGASPDLDTAFPGKVPVGVQDAIDEAPMVKQVPQTNRPCKLFV